MFLSPIRLKSENETGKYHFWFHTAVYSGRTMADFCEPYILDESLTIDLRYSSNLLALVEKRETHLMHVQKIHFSRFSKWSGGCIPLLERF